MDALWSRKIQGRQQSKCKICGQWDILREYTVTQDATSPPTDARWTRVCRACIQGTAQLFEVLQ